MKEDLKNVDSRIYCCNCKHTSSNSPYEMSFARCEADENKEILHDWFHSYSKLKDEPSKINKNNDCKWYEPFEGGEQ